MTIKDYYSERKPNYTKEEIRDRLENGKRKPYVTPEWIEIALIELHLTEAEKEYL